MSSNQQVEAGTYPLSGITVVEYGDFISGPYCARLLADAGARVIKVESPEGDEARRRGPFPSDTPDPNRSGLFMYLNANKQGMTLDLNRPEAKEVLLDLLRDADVLVENNPPSVMKEMELDFPRLHTRFPRLIMTSVTPFGQTGPYQDYRGDDLIAMNMGGLAYATPGLPDHIEDPVKEPPLRPATYLSDFVAGLAGAVATFFALFSRLRDGVGRHVDVSQQEAVASMMLWDIAHHSYLGTSKKRFPTAMAGVEPNKYMPCKDGYVAIVAFSDDHWRKLVQVMGDPDWAKTELFDVSYSRAQYWDALGPMILEWTMSHTGQEICELAQAKGLPCFPAYEVADTLESQQVAARGSLVGVESGGDSWRMPGPPFRFSHLSLGQMAPAPRLGQHTEKILKNDLGYDADVLARLRAQEAI
ncbi:MAG: CaiB/BaiF CoA transferase family protein [Dehalococcoidia bacterium]